MTLTTLSRDPFARHDHVRDTVPKYDRRLCEWCGSRPGRFRYGVHNDASPRPYLRKHAFCSVSCARTYYQD